MDRSVRKCEEGTEAALIHSDVHVGLVPPIDDA